MGKLFFVVAVVPREELMQTTSTDRVVYNGSRSSVHQVADIRDVLIDEWRMYFH